ncbi:glutamyl-tRNA reductase [Methylobacterium sp. Leaf111]|jgi:hypothetical protein|uniref:DUF6468 domain-containing protein n=1 Tax=Methylobacterium sp. Leaf111 TaxID=1736257 RepID=UPI0006F5301D|nr:DUF6468 domain-containing protein [Methylobacterium sp. Leaf111]KQP68780.1 glutamyl-tRNA reductase [Methylobacterium sp. Leaf111]
MSLLVTLLADGLVAVLLVASIVSSMRLSGRITKLKADEAALRQTIGDLVMASSTAERAIVGLRATLDECDRTLADRLGTAERYATDLAAHVEAGETVIARIASIVAQAAPTRELARTAAPAPELRDLERVVPPVRVAPPAPSSPNGERLGVAAAAALAMSERALGRLRSKAA